MKPESRPHLVTGLAWILKHRRAPDGRPWSMRSLSLAAGLSHSHVAQILSGRVKADRVSVDVLESLARVAGVSVEWLRTGREAGAVELPASHVEPTPEFPSLAAALVILRAQGYPEWVLEALAHMRRKGDEDPGLDGPSSWFAIAADVLRYGEQARAALGDDPKRAK